MSGPLPPQPGASGSRTVLVTGAGGRLGGRLAGLLASRFRVVAGVHVAPAPVGVTTQSLDLTDARSALGWEPRSLDEAIRSGRSERD